MQVGRLADSDQQVQQGEHLLTRLTQLAASDKFAAHQALACQKALLELKLCKPVQALTTVLPYVAEGEEGAARWAVHLAAHIYWLEGELDQVHALAHLLSCQGYSTDAIALVITQATLCGVASAMHCLFCLLFVLIMTGSYWSAHI